MHSYLISSSTYKKRQRYAWDQVEWIFLLLLIVLSVPRRIASLEWITRKEDIFLTFSCISYVKERNMQ